VEAESCAKEKDQGQLSRLTVGYPNVAISLLSHGTSTSRLTRGKGLPWQDSVTDPTHEPSEIAAVGTGAARGYLPSLE
jgi:hypothetical protein